MSGRMQDQLGLPTGRPGVRDRPPFQDLLTRAKPSGDEGAPCGKALCPWCLTHRGTSTPRMRESVRNADLRIVPPFSPIPSKKIPRRDEALRWFFRSHRSIESVVSGSLDQGHELPKLGCDKRGLAPIFIQLIRRHRRCCLILWGNHSLN